MPASKLGLKATKPDATTDLRVSLPERLALIVTQHVGTMGFFAIIVAWTLAWFTWNMAAPPRLKFDPYPGFVLWLFISNMIQLFLMPLIMVGQNLQGKHAEARSENDYKVNTKAEKEIQQMQAKLDAILELLKMPKQI